MPLRRRELLEGFMALPLVAVAAGCGGHSALMGGSPPAARAMSFEIGIQSWTFHMPVWRRQIDIADLPQLIRKEYGVDGIEWSNGLLRPLGSNGRPQFTAPKDGTLARDLRQRCDDAGVRSLIVTLDGPSILGHVDAAKRDAVVDHYVRWAEPAVTLGCHAIRINLYTNLPKGPGRYAEALDLCAEGVARVLAGTAGSELDVLVENHGGISSRGDFIADLVRRVDDSRLGTVVDFNNFRYDIDLPFEPDLTSTPRWYDREKGVREIAPWARSVSAKAFAFDHTGWEATLDYPTLMRIVLDAGFRGYVAAEYEGPEDPLEGTRKTILMLRRLREQLLRVSSSASA